MLAGRTAIACATIGAWEIKDAAPMALRRLFMQARVFRLPVIEFNRPCGLPNLQIHGPGLSGFPSFGREGHSRFRGEPARALAAVVHPRTASHASG